MESFAANARIVHIDIDPAEIHKNKHAHIPVCADTGAALRMLNKALEANPVDKSQTEEWRQGVAQQKADNPLDYPDSDRAIMPQWAIKACTKTYWRSYLRSVISNPHLI